MNIANALEAEFSLEEQQNIEKIPTTSPEAYALYLKAAAAGENLSLVLLDQGDQSRSGVCPCLRIQGTHEYVSAGRGLRNGPGRSRGL